MEIIDAIKLAHRKQKKNNDVWHIIRFNNVFEVVKESYFENINQIFQRESIYNTKEGLYNGTSYEDIVVRMKLGDLLESEEKYIIHQCNCVSINGGGLAYHLFKKFPYADVYSERDSGETNEKGYPILLYKDQPGTIKIKGDGLEKRLVINAFSQYYPGGQNTYSNDDTLKRLEYFQSCLDEVKKIKDLESIAFPYEYGCGIAGGNWSIYKKMIIDFAIDVDASVKIYKLPNL